MATGAKLGYPTLFKRGDGASPEVFTTIAEVKAINGFGISREIIEATNFDSPNFFKEFISGMKDGKPFTITCNFLPAHATQSLAAGVAKDIDDGTVRNYKIVWPFSPTYTHSFAALVLDFTVSDATPNAILAATYQFKPSGTITGA